MRKFIICKLMRAGLSIVVLSHCEFLIVDLNYTLCQAFDSSDILHYSKVIHLL